MAGEAAVTKIKIALQAWLTGQIGADVEIDRPYDRPYGDDTLDTVQVNIRIPSSQFEQDRFNSGLRHIASVMFDITTRSGAVASIDAQQAEVAANIVARLAARTPTPGTIGYLLEKAEPLGFGTEAEDPNLADHGETTFAYRITWFTPTNDIRTIFAFDGTLVP